MNCVHKNPNYFKMETVATKLKLIQGLEILEVTDHQLLLREEGDIYTVSHNTEKGELTFISNGYVASVDLNSEDVELDLRKSSGQRLADVIFYFSEIFDGSVKRVVYKLE